MASTKITDWMTLASKYPTSLEATAVRAHSLCVDLGALEEAFQSSLRDIDRICDKYLQHSPEANLSAIQQAWGDDEKLGKLNREYAGELDQVLDDALRDGIKVTTTLESELKSLAGHELQPGENGVVKELSLAGAKLSGFAGSFVETMEGRRLHGDALLIATVRGRSHYTDGTNKVVTALSDAQEKLGPPLEAALSRVNEACAALGASPQ